MVVGVVVVTGLVATVEETVATWCELPEKTPAAASTAIRSPTQTTPTTTRRRSIVSYHGRGDGASSWSQSSARAASSASSAAAPPNQSSGLLMAASLTLPMSFATPAGL